MKKIRIPPGTLQLLWVVIFVAVSVFISRTLRSQYEPPQRHGGEELVISGDAVVVAPAPYRIHFTTTGTVEAKTEIDIVPQVSGRVEEVAERFGQGGFFDHDEMLFQLEREDFIYEIQRLEAEVARAQTALELERAQQKRAIADWKELSGDRPIPALVKRQPQLHEAEANLRAANAQLNKAKLQLERASYRLPAAGRVLDSRVAPGQYLQAGVSYGKAFYFDDLEVVASLDDQQLQWLYSSKDPEITVTSTYLGNTTTSRAKLDRGAASVDPQTRFATVRFSLENGAQSLLPGVFVRVEVVGATYDGVSRIPLGAIQQGGHIWLVDEQERLRKHHPEILNRATDYVTIRSLDQSSRVMTLQLPGAMEGARVKLREDDDAVALAEN